MSARVTYQLTEHPQALIRPTSLPAGITGNTEWAVMEDGLSFARTVGAEGVVSETAGAITLPPGVWRVTVSGVYTSIDAAVMPIAFDELSTNQPGPQAISEGTQFATGVTTQQFEFSRVIHVDERDGSTEFVLWGECTDDGVEGAGGVQFDDLTIEVTHIADDSVILGRAWWAGGVYADTVNQSAVRSSTTTPADDSDSVSHWYLRVSPDYATNPALLRSGGATAPTFDVDGFDARLPAVHFGASEGLHADFLASAFSGDTTFTFVLEFEFATASLVNTLLSLADDAGDYLDVLEVSSNLRVIRTNGSGVVTGSVDLGALGAGKHWLVVRYEVGGTLTAWLDSTTPVVDSVSLAGVFPTVSRVSFGIHRDTVGQNPSTSDWPLTALVPGKAITQTEVNAIAAHLAAVGDF